MEVFTFFSSIWEALPEKLSSKRYEALPPGATTLVTPCLALMVPVLFLLLLTEAWRRHFEGQKNSACALPLPPGGFGWPLVGETLDFAIKGSDFFLEKTRQYGAVYKTHFLGSPTVRTGSSKQISQLISKEVHSLCVSQNHGPSCIFGKQSIILADGAAHARMKKVLSGAFTSSRLADYVSCTQSCVRCHVNSWCELPVKQQVLGYDLCQKLVCELILETVVGCTSEHDPKGEVRDAFVTCINNLFSVPIFLPGTGFYKAMQARQVLVNFVNNRIASSISGEQDHVTVLDVLVAHHRHMPSSGKESTASGDKTIDGGQLLTDDELIDNAVSLLIAGTDTVSSAMCSVLWLLGTHPEKLAMLRNELASHDLLENSRGNDLNFDLLQLLPYTQAVVKEALRILPPVGASFRGTKRNVEMEDYQIPKDWRVVYSIRDLHQTTEAFSETEKFIPERWLNMKENQVKGFNYNYAPFGFASRTCVGKKLAMLEIGVFVVELARSCDWTLLNPSAKCVYLPVTKPVDNLPIVFKQREH